MESLKKTFSLFVFAFLALAAFWIEKKMSCGHFIDILSYRYCFFIIPALFAVWLLVFCHVRAALWRWCVFAASYAIWFCLSYFFWLCLNDFSLGTIFGLGYFFMLLGFVLNLFSLDIDTYFNYQILITILALCIASLYALFIVENIAVKKLFRLSFRKIDWIMLFSYPVLIALFSVPAQFIVILTNFGADYLDRLLQIDSYFFSGTIIFGYMMTEGLLFIRGTKSLLEIK